MKNTVQPTDRITHHVRNVKRKGSEGEREVCRILEAAGFTNAHRNEQRMIGGYDNPDIDADGLCCFHMEVKRVERLNVSEAMKQARRDAAGRVPIVIHRRTREPWLVTMPLEDWLPLARSVQLPDDW